MFTPVLQRAVRRSLGLFVVLAILTVPAVVVANHQFPDVPFAHPFHDEISAIANAGITAGFGDGTYKPGEPVTRQAMAAFMERGFGHVRMSVGNAPDSASVVAVIGQASTTPVGVRSLGVNVPGASNAFSPSQYVYLHGRVSFDAPMSTGGNGCPCEFTATIKDVTENTTSTGQSQTFESSSSTALIRTLDVEAIFPASPGDREFQLIVALSFRVGAVNSATFTLDNSSSLTAATFPFRLQEAFIPE